MAAISRVFSSASSGAARLFIVLVLVIAFSGCAAVLLWLRILGRRSRPSAIAPAKDASGKVTYGKDASLSATQLLSDLFVAANRCGIRPFLMSGTLLGFLREGKVLEHDYDVDVGIFAGDPKLPEFLELIEVHPRFVRLEHWNYSLLERIANPWLDALGDHPIVIKLVFQNESGLSPPELHVDLFMNWPSNGYVAHGGFRTVWINTEFDIKPVVMNDVTYWIPENPEKYLEENYGNWKSEQKEFVSSTDCPNAMNIYGVRSATWIAGRYHVFARAGDSRRRGIIVRRAIDFWTSLSAGPSATRWRIGKFEG